MYFKQSLDRTITNWNLLKHSFYEAWSDGTLPQEALRTYAREYGRLLHSYRTVGRRLPMKRLLKKSGNTSNYGRTCPRIRDYGW